MKSKKKLRRQKKKEQKLLNKQQKHNETNVNKLKSDKAKQDSRLRKLRVRTATLKSACEKLDEALSGVSSVFEDDPKLGSSVKKLNNTYHYLCEEYSKHTAKLFKAEEESRNMKLVQETEVKEKPKCDTKGCDLTADELIDSLTSVKVAQIK